MTALFASRPFTTSPLSSDMISAVLSFADLAEPAGVGRTKLRISPQRLSQADVLTVMGGAAGRLADITVVWNEREGQVVRVIDDAQLRRSQPEPWEAYFDLFEEEPARLCA
ncbi:hypothetical protein [Caulobacter sp. NIBR2454]|uniref:hypothetical protein n=1 Tax=Caulobacter sp. NIBR2454 TaxID=3015996 RepID=UPI0022B63B35|nr:hypothetical protein [Caulobacter sp. NIBR2454]